MTTDSVDLMQTLGRSRGTPAGAAGMSFAWIDQSGRPQRSTYKVPIDADGRRTEHVRHTCRGSIEVDGERRQCDTVKWLLPTVTRPSYCADHGCLLTAERERREPWTGWADLREALGGKPLALVPLGVTAAAGVGVQAGGVPSGLVALACPALAGAAWAGSRWWMWRDQVRRGNIDPADEVTGRRARAKVARRARHAGYAAAGAGAWLAAAAAVDPTSAVGVLAWPALVGAWAAGSVPWWRYCEARRSRQVVEAPEADVEPEPDAGDITAQQAASDWAEHVALPGTSLDVATFKKIPCGWQAAIVATKRGALSMLAENMPGVVRKISGGLDVPRSAITILDEHEGSPNRALLLVQPHNPLSDGQIWPGPQSIAVTDRAITAETGRAIDGSVLTEDLFRFGWGAPSGITLGTTGSGKSERLRKKLVIERWTHYVDPETGAKRGLFLSFLHDPKRMEAYAEFTHAVHGYGITRDDAHIMVDAFLRELDRRYDYLRSLPWQDRWGRRREGSQPFNPILHGPVISVIWDEFHELAADAEFIKKLERLARKQRACGMRAEIASHMGTLGDTGSQALRDMLAGGRATLLRTTSALNAGLVSGGQLAVDPRGLPKAPGMAYVVDGEDAHQLMARESYLPADETKADVTLYDWLYDRDNRPIGYPAVIPPETVEAFGPEFMEWMAAGRQSGGRSGGKTATYVAAAVPGEDGSALDALLRILGGSAQALSRPQIVAHEAWGARNATSTLSKALSDAVGHRPPLAVKVGGGPKTAYQITVDGRRRLDHGAAVAVEEQMAMDLERVA